MWNPRPTTASKAIFAWLTTLQLYVEFPVVGSCLNYLGVGLQLWVIKN